MNGCFGNMQPVAGIGDVGMGDRDIASVTAPVRTLQRANGIQR